MVEAGTRKLPSRVTSYISTTDIGYRGLGGLGTGTNLISHNERFSLHRMRSIMFLGGTLDKTRIINGKYEVFCDFCQ